jgi:uncharacterized metal-binding protein
MDGKAHAAASVVLAVPSALVALGVTGDQRIAGAVALGCAAGVPMTPDLDQEGIGWIEWQMVRWTFGLGFLWLMAWYGYAKILPHRHPLSHAPVIGTAIRVAWLALWVLALDRLVIGYDVLGWLATVPAGVWLGAFVGLCVSDAAHLAMDAVG